MLLGEPSDTVCRNRLQASGLEGRMFIREVGRVCDVPTSVGSVRTENGRERRPMAVTRGRRGKRKVDGWGF